MAGNIRACPLSSARIVDIGCLIRLGVRDTSQTPRSVQFLHGFVAVNLGVLLDVLNLFKSIGAHRFRCSSHMLRSLQSNEFLVGDTASKPPETRHRVLVVGSRRQRGPQVILSLRSYITLHLDDPFSGDGIGAIDPGQRGSKY
jgi:hypothetical protein